MLARFSGNLGKSLTKVAVRSSTTKVEDKKTLHYDEFPEIYPDFAKTPIMGRRNNLRERLERMDMLNRRMNIDIPEFYVGSIVAVTTSDPNLASKKRRFVGICIRREREGLMHNFTLRNVVDGLGVEVMYELYNPTILKIEALKLEKRLDTDLSYLIDCTPQYSTFDFNLEPIAHPAGAPIPVNETKAELRPPPWTRRWELYPFQGIKDSWSSTTPYFKRKLHKTKVNDWRKFDLIADYRTQNTNLEHEIMVEKEIRNFEDIQHKAGTTKKRILRSAARTQ